MHGKFDVVKLLLEHGINPHGTNRQGQTVMVLLRDHQSQQKSFTEISQSINGNTMFLSERNISNSIISDSVYDDNYLGFLSEGNIRNSIIRDSVYDDTYSGFLSEGKISERIVCL